MAFHRTSQIVTYAPNGTDPRYLGSIGPVGGLVRDYVLPGGCNSLQATLMGRPASRQRAIDSGRIIQVMRGALPIWDGKMDEPTPVPGGWQINAHGSGTFGADEMAYFTNYSSAGDPVNQAITNRGLRWKNPYSGGVLPGPLYLGQPPDPASISITDYLNGITGPANYLWYVRTPFNVLQVFPFPATPTRLLYATTPQARALYGYYNYIWLRYTSHAQTASGGAATFATTSIGNPLNQARHGNLETYADLSAAPAMTATAAQAVGTAQLAKYVAASWAGPFTVRHGQYRTMGGAAVDLGCEQAGEVVQLVLAAGGYGGEVVPVLPTTFVVGQYSYDEDAQLGTVTPFQFASSSLSDLLGNWATEHTPATATGAAVTT